MIAEAMVVDAFVLVGVTAQASADIGMRAEELPQSAGIDVDPGAGHQPVAGLLVRSVEELAS
jgi:hypothetical protein